MIDSTKTLEEISEHQGARRKAHSTSWQDRTCYKNLTTRQEADFKPGLISVANFSCHSHRRGTWVWLVLHLSNKIKRNESNTSMHFCTATLTRLFTDAHFTVSERRWYQTRRAAKVQSVQRQSVEQETLGFGCHLTPTGVRCWQTWTPWVGCLTPSCSMSQLQISAATCSLV